MFFLNGNYTGYFEILAPIIVNYVMGWGERVRWILCPFMGWVGFPGMAIGLERQIATVFDTLWYLVLVHPYGWGLLFVIRSLIVQGFLYPILNFTFRHSEISWLVTVQSFSFWPHFIGKRLWGCLQRRDCEVLLMRYYIDMSKTFTDDALI